MKKLLRALAGLAIIAVSLFIAKALIGMKEERPVTSPPRAIKLVKTMPVETASIAPLSMVKGRAVALDRMELFAEVNGLILNSGKTFREGTRYERGEVMLRLDAGELDLTLVAQRSAFLQLLTGALPDLRIDLPARFDTWYNYTANFDVEAPLKELPKPTSEQEKFFLSNRGILNQYYTIRSSEERLAKYTLVAPFAGEVVMSAVNTGALVRPGQKLGELVSLTGFEVESAVSRDALAVIQVGDEVAFQADGNSDTLKGKVARIMRTIDQSTQTAKVFCTVDAAQLRDGMYLSGAIRSTPIDSVMQLARELLVNDGEVYTVVGDTLLRLVPVQVMNRSERTVLVRGLPNDALLLAEPVTNAFDGMTISVAKE